MLLDNKVDNDRNALIVLNDLFLSLISSIADLTAPATSVDAERMHRICEGVLDLAAFAPSIVCKIFEDSDDETNEIRQQFLQGVIQTCQLGYSRSPAGAPADEVTLQV